MEEQIKESRCYFSLKVKQGRLFFILRFSQSGISLKWKEKYQSSLLYSFKAQELGGQKVQDKQGKKDA